MESTTVVSTYKRYKAGTQKLVTWLVASANECLPPAARREGSGTKVTVAELVACAERIVASLEPRIDITREILDIVRDVIAGRKECAAWYANTKTAASTDGHAHYITVLERVFAILKAEAKARMPVQQQQELEDVSSVANIFALLHLEEPVAPSTGPEQQQQPSGSKATAAEQQPQKLLADTTQEETSFGIWCLFKDVFDIRMRVRDIWDEFRNGVMSAITASRLTQAAINIIWARGREFAEAFPGQGLISTLDEIHPSLFKADHDNAKSVRPSGAVPSRDNPADLFCVKAYFGLVSLKSAAESATGPPNASELAEMADQLAECHPFAQSLLEHADLLLNFVARDHNGQPLALGFASLVKHDRFLGALVQYMALDVKLNLTMLASMQIYMDMHDVLNGRLDLAFNGLNAPMELATQCIPKTEAFLATAMFAANWAVEQIDLRILGALTELKARHKPTLRGGELFEWVSLVSVGGQQEVVVTLPVELMRCLLLVPDGIAFDRLQTLSMQGIGLCANKQILSSVAHLYKAARACGALDTVWHDLEYAIARQNEKAKFVRTTNQQVEAVYKAFLISTGQKLATVAFLTGKSQTSRKPDGAPLGRPIRMQLVSAYATATDEIQKSGQGSSVMDVLYGCVRHHASKGTGIADSEIREQWQDTKSLAPVQLLTVLQEAFLDEEIDLHFDYLALGNRCLTLLDLIRKTLTPAKASKEMVEKMRKILVTELTEMILRTSTSCEQAGLPMKSSTISKVGDLMKECLEDFGDELFEHAKGLSSNAAWRDQIPGEAASNEAAPGEADSGKAGSVVAGSGEASSSKTDA